jgi:hypothetical protein
MDELSLSERARHAFTIPSTKGVSSAFAVPNYMLEDPVRSKEYALVDFRTALKALCLPQHAQENRARIWPTHLDDYLPADMLKEIAADQDQTEAMNTIQGKAKGGFGIVVLRAANEDKPVNMYVIEDKARGAMMVAGPQPISYALQADLARNGIEYVSKNEPCAVAAVNNFLAASALQRAPSGVRPPRIVEALVKAFSAVCELPDHYPDVTRANNGDMVIGRGVNLGQLVHDNKSAPAVFTSIVAPKI